MATQPVPNEDPFAEGPTEEELQKRVLEAAAGSISRLYNLCVDAVNKRKQTEERWLEDERAYHGKYDRGTEAELRASPTKSRAIVNLTRTKTDAWSARLFDFLFPTDDKNWGINETPVPELVDAAQRLADGAAAEDAAAAQQVEQSNQQQAATGEPDGAALAKAEQHGSFAARMRQHEAKARKEMEVAKKAAEAMSAEIDDQLTESRYPKRCRDIIEDGTRLGSGIIKGPVLNAVPSKRWTRAENSNVYELQLRKGPRPGYVRVAPWHFFPDPNATSMEDCEYTFERHLKNPSGLRRMAKELGFSRAAVLDLLRGGPGYAPADDTLYLTELRAITGEGEAVTGKFVIWEYNGPLERDEVVNLVRAAGRVEDAARFEETYDEMDEVRVVLYFCNNRLLKVSEDYVLDSGESLYSVWSFAKSEGSVLGGIGIPRIMHDPSRALNAAWRMMLDNAGLSVGPQVVVDKNQVEPEDGDWRLRPRKVWIRTGRDVQAQVQSRVFELFNIPNNQKELAGIIELAIKFIDDVTNLPMIAQGDQDSHITTTSSGMAMLFNSANVIFRRTVKNWDDDLTTPTVNRLFDWNMQFNDKEGIRGDMTIEARGTAVLLVRELQSQNLTAITTTWSTHPVLGPALKAYHSARMTLQSLMINPDDVLEPEDVYLKKLSAMAKAAGESGGPEELKAQVQLQIAQMEAATREKQMQVEHAVALLRFETEGMRLVADKEMTMEQLRARLAEKQLALQSQERMKAVDIAVEEERERKAEARGDDPAAASGQGIG